MRVLILSGLIYDEQEYGKSKYIPPYDTHIDFGEINQSAKIRYSIFDYDISIVHINPTGRLCNEYCENLMKISNDSKTALESGKTIIVFPESDNFVIENVYKEDKYVYSWLENFNIFLIDNEGENYVATGLGKSKVIINYLKQTKKY